jgi:hypothetical protein
MTIEYRTTPEELARFERIIWARQWRFRLLTLGLLYGSGAFLTAGGILLALADGASWLMLAVFGLLVEVLAAATHLRLRPSLAKARKRREEEQWRNATYRVHLDDAGITWERPGIVSRMRWEGVAEILDRDGFFILIERRSAATIGFLIPRGAFPNEAALREVTDLFRRNVPRQNPAAISPLSSDRYTDARRESGGSETV